MQELVRRVSIEARDAMERQDPAHDWPHIERVRTWAMRIADDESKRQPVNKLIVELAALTHDVGDRKVHGSDEAGRRAVRHILSTCKVPRLISEPVLKIAMNISYKGHGVPDVAATIEHKCVQDGDRLDAIGAIAIARTFSWGGSRGRKIHDPDQEVFLADNADDYYRNEGTSIHHFHEKLLHLKDRLHTDMAKTEAKRRHEFMELFLQEFEREWKCE